MGWSWRAIEEHTLKVVPLPARCVISATTSLKLFNKFMSAVSPLLVLRKKLSFTTKLLHLWLNFF